MVRVQLRCSSINKASGRPYCLNTRSLRFTGKFWTSVFTVLRHRLDMSTADHSQTDGQTERDNRVVEDVLRSICAETPKHWSAMLPLVEFALNNAVHASTGYTPFYVNGLSRPHVPLTPPRPGSGLNGEEEVAERLTDIIPLAVRKQIDAFLTKRLSVLRHVRDAMAESQNKQKDYADANGRSNVHSYQVGDLVLLNVKNLPTHTVSAVFKTKLRRALLDLSRSWPRRAWHQKVNLATMVVPEELGLSPAAGAASQYHRNSDRHAGERLGRELGAHSNSERTQSPRSTSPEDSVAARRPPPALLDEQGESPLSCGTYSSETSVPWAKPVSGKVERQPSHGELMGV
ncbi:unnamed protein product [Phytophthora fragariaefolia]|uniref:Unnamed protein product n=1 Tax=Phytophthora fragariaefolia TaxID=1490495 RepID=A0A9W6U7L4_9STRA|nr:unnamed protein product [Phytophthora fragariaefolia]